MTTVILSSGGLDSAVMCCMEPDAKYHLTVDYGQRHCREIDSAALIAKFYGAQHFVVRSPLRAFGGSSLTNMRSTDLDGSATIVPNRNMVLIGLGVALAESRGGGEVLIGCNADDAAIYPDCRDRFMRNMMTSVQDATEGRVHLRAPLLRWGKETIGAHAREWGVPVDLTWSCYEGGDEPCGNCGACVQLKRAGF